MSHISEVIGWKFDNMEGMSTKGDEITQFPAGVPGVTYDGNGIPVQSDQDAWTAEYDAVKGKQDQMDAIDEQEEAIMAAGFPYTHDGNDYLFEFTAAFIDGLAVLKRSGDRGKPTFKVPCTLNGVYDIANFSSKADFETFQAAIEDAAIAGRETLNDARKVVADS